MAPRVSKLRNNDFPWRAAPASPSTWLHLRLGRRKAPGSESRGRSGDGPPFRRACTWRAPRRTASSARVPVSPTKSVAIASSSLSERAHLELLLRQAANVVREMRLEAARAERASCVLARKDPVATARAVWKDEGRASGSFGEAKESLLTHGARADIVHFSVDTNIRGVLWLRAIMQGELVLREDPLLGREELRDDLRRTSAAQPRPPLPAPRTLLG